MKSRREISEEERALLRAALRDVKPIAKRERIVYHARPAKISPPRQSFPATNEPAFNEAPAPSIGGHVEAHLRRGRSEPEARLDLHGLKQRNAYRVLIEFLLRAQSEDKRLVLVITGKGGVLREQFPLWLGQGDLKFLVGGISPAHAKHGGAGAFYVRLRKTHTR